jgi:(1->4)-alpha-D-glucan 1-alpha-D-glucosylmutase
MIEQASLQTLVVPEAESVSAVPAIPRATYRLQLTPQFTFADAARIVPYLAALGISHCYASPVFRARRGSTHGYDVSDHRELNPELGGAAGFTQLAAALREHHLGLVLDVVPNHMTIGDSGNLWWMDVLENGPCATYASYFDIDWHPSRPNRDNTVLLPILEDQYGKVLESGKLGVIYEDGGFFVTYYETHLPVAPDTYPVILTDLLSRLSQTMEEADEAVQELESILTALSYLPGRTETAPERVAERYREKEVIKRRLAALLDDNPTARAALDATLMAMRGTVGDRRSFDRLDELLTAQVYRLSFWRVATEEINYRRFFDVNDLAAIRVERPEIFQATHELAFQLLAEAAAPGLRVDHPDGLWDPAGYFRRLQQAYLEHQSGATPGPSDSWSTAVSAGGANGRALGAREPAVGNGAGRPQTAAPESGGLDRPWPLYVVAEKILEDGESLPADWAVYGTTGYDFLNLVGGLWVDESHRKSFDRLYRDFTGNDASYRNLLNSSKKMIMLISLASEVNALSNLLARIAEANRWYRDFTLNSLTYAIREVIASLPVYRTYIVAETGEVPARDVAYVTAAVREAKKRNPRTAAMIFDFIGDTLLLRNLDDFRVEDRATVQDFVMKFQQVTGPVMAKGAEDTAFYVYNRLVSLNEVGGNPDRFGVSVDAFHRQIQERAVAWPHTMLASSTHDTKRSEDVRARICVLSEIPREWRAALGRWARLNARKKRPVDDDLAPSRNDEYLFYQNLLGVWPDDPPDAASLAQLRERLTGYMQKATKEAKVHTSWVNPNEDYDAAVRDFVAQVLADKASRDPFLRDFQDFHRRIRSYGRVNALAQTLLKLTVPGVPDLYQGTELWDLSLVDPDNRRPVDFERRQQRLAQLRADAAAAGDDRADFVRRLSANDSDGAAKLYLIDRTLGYRREHPDLFAQGDYRPLLASGSQADHVVAFARTRATEQLLTVVPRLVVRLTGGLASDEPRLPLGADVWQDTWLPLSSEGAAPAYRNRLTGRVLVTESRDGEPGLPLAAVLAEFPVALLEALYR